jgi:hypothetical protein
VGKPNLPVADPQPEGELPRGMVEPIADPQAPWTRGARRANRLPLPKVVDKHFDNNAVRGHNPEHPPFEAHGASVLGSSTRQSFSRSKVSGRSVATGLGACSWSETDWLQMGLGQ